MATGRSPWTLGRAADVALGLALAAGIVAGAALSLHALLTPVDIGGTVFGDAMSVPLNLAGWIVAMAGVLLAALLRLPGFRLAWIAVGLLPALIGGLVLWHYPDGSALIVSPTRSDIALAMVLGGVFLVLGALLGHRQAAPRLEAPWPRRLVLTVLAAVALGVPLLQGITALQPDLPPCAHDEAGRQLTLCDHPYREPAAGE